MGPELDDFIEQYRALLHQEADAQADWLREQLEDFRGRFAGDPESDARWRAFENLVRSDASLEEKLKQYGFVLSGGTLGRLQ